MDNQDENEDATNDDAAENPGDASGAEPELADDEPIDITPLLANPLPVIAASLKLRDTLRDALATMSEPHTPDPCENWDWPRVTPADIAQIPPTPDMLYWVVNSYANGIEGMNDRLLESAGELNLMLEEMRVAAEAERAALRNPGEQEDSDENPDKSS
ncbi:MAG: hypothetical protein ACRCSF_08135 [Mycobacteriaceae bacterium]